MPTAILAFLWTLFYIPNPNAPMPRVLVEFNAQHGTCAQHIAAAPVGRCAMRAGIR